MPEIHESRLIGQFNTPTDGPWFIAVGGMHGNEPAGIPAIQRVLEKMVSGVVPFRGKFIGLYGNRKGLAQNKRFIDRDLNRKWEPEFLETIRNPDISKKTAEDEEQLALTKILNDLSVASPSPLIVMDLHSTSAHGIPFCGMADTLRNRKIAFAIPVPLILGLEETIDGSMLGYVSDMGHIAIAFEGGQHEDPKTINHHESALWLALAAAGCVDGDQTPHYQRLHQLGTPYPRVMEIRYRHVVACEDNFKMEPGFENFQPITKGELLAKDQAGDITASESGRILMPLYQKLGEDGFFIGRDVSFFWLVLSAFLRRLRMDRLIPLLPGITPHPDKADHFIADPKIARFFTVEIFHLFGYRKCKSVKGKLHFTRRRPDHINRFDQ